MNTNEPLYREIERTEIPNIWSIDRREFIQRVYRCIDGELVLEDHIFEVPGWPPGTPEAETPEFYDCFDRGGSFVGAFIDSTLVGISILESRFIGPQVNKLQLRFLHVGRDNRATGVGQTLFNQAAQRARDLGASMLYISATPSENTVNFYRRLGCSLSTEPEPTLLALEPLDIHLEFVIRNDQDR